VEHGHGRDARQVGLDGTIDQPEFIEAIGGVGGRISVPELEGAEAGLDRLGADPAMRIGILSVRRIPRCPPRPCLHPQIVNPTMRSRDRRRKTSRYDPRCSRASAACSCRRRLTSV
jgi:hypothetical protein